MCNFNAICCHCKRFCHGANCCGCCKKHADVDKSAPRLLTDSLIVTRSSEITIDPVSNEITLSLSNSRSSTTVDIDRNSTNMRSRSSKTSVRMGSIIASVKSPSPMESTSPSIGSSKAPSRIGSTLYGLPTETLISSSKEPSRMGSTVPSIVSSKAPSRTGSTPHGLPTETLISSSKEPSRMGSTVPSIFSSKAPSRTGSTPHGPPTETLISSSKEQSRMGSTVPSIGSSKAPSRTGSTPHGPPTETLIRASKAPYRMGSTVPLISSFKAPSRIGSTVPSIVSSKAPSRTGSTLHELPSETLISSSKAPSRRGSNVTSVRSKSPSRTGSTLNPLPTETLISSSKAPSRMGSTVPSIGPSKAPSRIGSTVTSVRSKSPSRTGSTLNPLPTETLISSSKAPSRMGSTVPSIGSSKAPSRIGSTVTSVRSKSPSRTGSTLNPLPTETAVVKYTKNSANGSVAPSPSGSTLTKNSTKVPFVEYPIKPTRNSILSSRMGSTLTTKDPSTNALSRQADELRRSNPRPVNPTVWQEENNLLVKRFLNQAYQIGFPEKKLMNCCNCCCKRLPHQQKGSQNKTDTKIIRSEIKPNERSNRPLSYLRTVKSKQEPRITEKALEMPKSKSKTKPKRAKRKIIVSQPEAKADEGNDLWFECNVPMRVSIPAAICLGAPWDILSSIPKILQTNNNNNKKLKALPAPGSNNKTLAKPGRNLRPPKTPEISENSTRKFCITVYPMGCGPSVPQPTKEEIIEEPPPVEPRLPKKKMHSRKKDKSKLKDYTSRKGSKDISISGDMAHTKPRGYTSRKESENSSTSEDIYMSNDREQSLKRRKSMDRDSGDYTSRKGSKNYSLRDDMDNYKPRDFTSRKGSKDYSISGDKANTKPREYAYRKGSENSSVCQDVGNLKTCHCCMINNQEQCQKLLKSLDRENGDYVSRKGSKEYTLNSDMGNTNSRDYASQRGFRDNSISKGMANTKPREDNSMREDMSITKPRDYTSQEGSDDHSIKDDMAQPKRCRFSMTNNRERCYKLCTDGGLTSQGCSKNDPLWEYMADPPSSHGFVKNNQDHPLSDEITSPDDGDNKGCHCSSDDWENKGSQRGSEDIASPKSCQCNVKKNQRPSRESRKLIDNKIQDTRKGSDDISSPRSCQCNETINPDDGEDNPKTCNCTGENKGSFRESKDTYSPKGCQCNVKKNQEPSSKSRKSIDGDNRASRKGSDDISSDGEHKDSQKESEYEPLTKDPVLTQKRPTPPSESRNTVRKKRTPDVPFYDPVPTAKGPTSPSESRNTVPKKRTPDVPFYEPTERPRSSEPTVRRKPRTYVENVYPSPRRTNVEMSKYSISKILSEMSIKPRSVSHTSLNSKQSNRISIVDNPSVPKPKNNSDKSMKLYRTSQRSVSDESIVNKKINIMTDSSSDSKNAEFRSPSEKSLQSSGSRRNSLSRYDSNKSLLSRRVTEFMNSSNESVAGFKLKKVSDANIEARNSGGRNKSEMGGNILVQFMKMFSEHTESHTESTKHLVDKSTYVRTIDKNKTKHPKHGSSKQPSKATKFKKCQGRSVESETLQNIITAMPPHSKNRLIELLKQENNDNFKKSIMESQGTSDIFKDTKLQWLIENKSELFQLLSSLSPPSKGHHTDVHVSSLSQSKKQLGHDQFPTVIDGLKLTSGPEKGFDQNNWPKSDHAEATKNDKKDNRHHYSKENEWSKKEHNYISKVKDFKIRLLRQETDNSPPVLEEYNVAAFTRSLSSHPLQTGGADSKLNCKCKNLCGDRDMEKLHAINEDNVETIWSDLKRFCQKNNAKYDDMLQKPVVLVPFRPDSEDNGQMMGMCKPDEWKELKFSRTNRNNQRPDSKSNSLTSKNLRANKCDHPKESMRRKYAKGSNIAPSSSKGKSNVCTCCTSPKDKSKLFEYLRKTRISNRSKFPNSESPQTETRQTHRTNRNSPQYEISERNFRPNSEAKSTSQFSKPQSSQAKDRRYNDSTSEQSVNEFQVSPKENIVSNRSESPNSRSAQVDKGNPFIQFEKPDNFYCPNAKSKVSSRGYDVSCPCSAQAERKKPKKCIQSEQSNRSYLPKRSKSPTTRSPQVERRKSDKFNESKVPKSEPQVSPREQNRSESPKPERSYRPKEEPQVSPGEQNRSESPKTERSYRPKAGPQVSRREQNRSESPKTERSYRPKAEPQVSPGEQNRSESPKPERSYRPKEEPQVSPGEQNRSESPKTERSYRPKAGPQVSRREQNRSESPKTERSYRPKAEPQVSPGEQNRSESPKTERSYRPKAETEVSPREQNRSESPKTERSYRPKAESPKENVAPIRSKVPKPRPFPAQPEDEAQLGVSLSSNDPSNQFESHSSFYPETEEQSNDSERNNQQNAQFHVSQSSDDVRKSAADHDIVSHLRPRLFRCGSKDLRCPEEFSENAASHEAKEPSSVLLIGREQVRDLRGKETISQQSESCVEYCNCSTNMTRDLHRQQQMQLLHKLQQANNEFDRRRQQQLEEYRGTQYGKKRREEAELICCYGYSQQQLQQRQQQRQQRQEQQQSILQQQQIMQQQQIQQQQYIKQQQQIQQQEYIKKQQMQQQEIQQQKIPQDEEYCCCCSCSDNFSQQQWTPQQQQQQHAQLMDKRTVPNIQQHEMQLHQYIQQQQQIEQQKYIKQQTQKQQHSQQQQQYGNLLDNHASPYFPQQQIQQHVRQQQLQQQEEKNSFTNYWQNSQQQKSQMIEFQENNGQNKALFNTTDGLVTSPQQQQLPNFPCCYCNIAPEPDLSDIRSSFYQQTLRKYGIQRLPEDFIPETVCCVPCSCCTCCPYAYGQQQQQRQH